MVLLLHSLAECWEERSNSGIQHISPGADLCIRHDNGNWLVHCAAPAELSRSFNSTLQHNIINEEMQHCAKCRGHYDSVLKDAAVFSPFIKSLKWMRQCGCIFLLTGNVALGRTLTISKSTTWVRLKHLCSYCTNCCTIVSPMNSTW